MAEPSSAKKRQRAEISVDELKDLLLKHATDDSKTVVMYDESVRVVDAKTDVPMIKEAHPLLTTLHGVQPNLSFKRSIVKTTFQAIFDLKADAWNMKAQFKDDWAETHTKRLMNICRVVSQAMVPSKKHPQWVRELPFYGTDKGTDDKGEVEATYFYGFNRELKLAWRTRADDKKQHKEMARPFNVEDLGPDDFPVAVWEDGHEHTMDTMTVAEYTSVADGRKSKCDPTVLWSGSHCVSHHKLTIRTRPDRSMLVVLFEQQKMILGVRTHLFCGEGEKPESEGPIAKAFEIIKQVADQYSNNLIQAEKLYHTRDEILMQKGISVRQVGQKAMKRPAAASVEKDPVEVPMKKKPTPEVKDDSNNEEADEDDENEDEESEQNNDDGHDKVSKTVEQSHGVALKRPAAAKAGSSASGSRDLSMYRASPPKFDDGLGDFDTHEFLSMS